MPVEVILRGATVSIWGWHSTLSTSISRGFHDCHRNPQCLQLLLSCLNCSCHWFLAHWWPCFGDSRCSLLVVLCQEKLRIPDGLEAYQKIHCRAGWGACLSHRKIEIKSKECTTFMFTSVKFMIETKMMSLERNLENPGQLSTQA